MNPRRRAARNFDHPDSVDRDLLCSHVAELAAGRPVQAPVYDFATHSRAAGRREVAPAPVIIVEGLFTLYWEELRAVLALAAFLDAPQQVCLARRIERDVRVRARSEASVRRQYELTVAPMFRRFVLPTRAHADLVLDATEPVARSVDAVVARILPGPGDSFSLPKGPSGS
jgi:uridine kinase